MSPLQHMVGENDASLPLSSEVCFCILILTEKEKKKDSGFHNKLLSSYLLWKYSKSNLTFQTWHIQLYRETKVNDKNKALLHLPSPAAILTSLSCYLKVVSFRHLNIPH